MQEERSPKPEALAGTSRLLLNSQVTFTYQLERHPPVREAGCSRGAVGTGGFCASLCHAEGLAGATCSSCTFPGTRPRCSKVDPPRVVSVVNYPAPDFGFPQLRQLSPLSRAHTEGVFRVQNFPSLFSLLEPFPSVVPAYS